MKSASSPHQRITASDVARFVGVSQATVSRAFSTESSITDLTRTKIMEAARQLNYVPNSLARGLITNQSNIVAMLIGDLHNPFYTAALDEFSSRLQAIGKQLLVFKCAEDETVEAAVRRMLAYQVDGLIITSATIPTRITDLCLERNIPVVMFNRYVPGLMVNSVSCNNVAGGALVADTLIAAGGTRYALIHGDDATSTNIDRVAGFTERLAENGIDLVSKAWGHYTYDGGYDAATTLLTQTPRPDALFCVNDIMALGAIDAARVLGVRIPEDLMVIGFDDIGEGARAPYRLTTVRQPTNRMIDEAMALLTQRPAGAAARVLEGRLIRRATTR